MTIAHNEPEAAGVIFGWGVFIAVPRLSQGFSQIPESIVKKKQKGCASMSLFVRKILYFFGHIPFVSYLYTTAGLHQQHQRSWGFNSRFWIKNNMVFIIGKRVKMSTCTCGHSCTVYNIQSFVDAFVESVCWNCVTITRYIRFWSHYAVN